MSKLQTMASSTKALQREYDTHLLTAKKYSLDGDLRQEKKYFENGSVYVFTREHFELTKNRLGGKIGYIIFPE